MKQRRSNLVMNDKASMYAAPIHCYPSGSFADYSIAFTPDTTTISALQVAIIVLGVLRILRDCIHYYRDRKLEESHIRLIILMMDEESREIVPLSQPHAPEVPSHFHSGLTKIDNPPEHSDQKPD